MRLLLVLDGAGEDGADDVQLAGAIVDIASESERSVWSTSGDIVDVIAPVIICVDLALPLLGRAAARTVEGGERRLSPLRLHPYSETDDDEIARQVLYGLFLGGAFEAESIETETSKERWRLDIATNLEDALARFLDRHPGPLTHVLLGSAGRHDFISRFRGRRVEDLKMADLQVIERVQELGGEISELEGARSALVSGARSALRLAHFVGELELG